MNEIVEKYVHLFVTALLGLFVGLYSAGRDAEIADNRFFLEKQAAAADAVALHFSDYIENWRRIRQLRSNYQKRDFKISDDELQHFKSVLKARNLAKDKLFSALDAGVLYFGVNVTKLSQNFRTWDNQQSEKRTEELPDLSEWHTRSRSILTAIREDLVK